MRSLEIGIDYLRRDGETFKVLGFTPHKSAICSDGWYRIVHGNKAGMFCSEEHNPGFKFHTLWPIKPILPNQLELFEC